MDSSIFNDLYKGFIVALVVAAFVGAGIFEAVKLLFHHVVIHWR
jgi:hypothetical protein